MTRTTRIVLMIGCGAFVGAAWVLPNCIKARTRASVNACLANLKQIDGAKATWALENKKTNSDTPTEEDLFGPTNYIKDRPGCPIQGTYALGRMDEKPRCSHPYHAPFLACAEVVDESGGPLSGVRIEGRADSSVLRGKTDRRGFCELETESDRATAVPAEQFVISKEGYQTRTLPMPPMWPLRATLKKEGQ